jgi:hypothetical protein
MALDMQIDQFRRGDDNIGSVATRVAKVVYQSIQMGLLAEITYHARLIGKNSAGRNSCPVPH